MRNSRPGHGFLVLLLLGLVTWVVPATGYAQACCSASSAGEVGVVGRCHDAMVSTTLDTIVGLGTIDPDGVFHRYERTRSIDGVLSLAAGLRPFDRRFRIGAVLPAHLQTRAGPDISTTAARPGDVGWSSGFYVLQDPMTGLSSPKPFLELLVGGTVPTGVHPGESSDPLGADVTSQASTSFGGGLKLIKFLTPAHAIRLSGEVRVFDGYDTALGRETVRLRPGNAWTTVLGYSYERSIFWSMGAVARATFQGKRRLSGEVLSDSGSRRVFLGLTLRRSLSFPFWDLVANVGEDVLLGDNQGRSGLSFGVGVRRNFL